MLPTIGTAIRSLALVAALLVTAYTARTAQPDPHELSVTAPQVQQYLQAAFPQEYDALGLFTLTASNPQLTIPATGERLLLAFDASASSPGAAERPVGRITVSSALRYDTRTSALYLEQPMIERMDPASSGHRVDDQTRMLLNVWLADYARKEPLYRLDPGLADTLGGVAVESARVRDGRIVVRFDKPVGMPELGDAQD